MFCLPLIVLRPQLLIQTAACAIKRPSGAGADCCCCCLERQASHLAGSQASGALQRSILAGSLLCAELATTRLAR